MGRDPEGDAVRDDRRVTDKQAFPFGEGRAEHREERFPLPFGVPCRAFPAEIAAPAGAGGRRYRGTGIVRHGSFP